MLWLTEDLKKEIRKVFEPRYQTKLTDEEIIEIAENLAGLSKALLKWRQKNEQRNV